MMFFICQEDYREVIAKCGPMTDSCSSAAEHSHSESLYVVIIYTYNPEATNQKIQPPQIYRLLLRPLSSYISTSRLFFKSRNPHYFFPPLLILLILIFFVAFA